MKRRGWRSMRAALRRIWLARFPRLFLTLCRASTAELGECGEELAARALRRAGRPVLGRRLNTPQGEVDVLTAIGDQLICLEVKSGRPSPRWRPGQRLDAARLRDQRHAGRWLAARLPDGPWQAGRVDLCEVLMTGRRGSCLLLWHEDIETPLDAGGWALDLAQAKSREADVVGHLW